ncbi:MAG: VOC family protein [Phycisphaerae bacterium]
MYQTDLAGVLETVLYCRDHNYAETIRFYENLLGLRNQRMRGTNGYRLGASILLIFNADRSANQASPPPHGTSGRAHTCFVAPKGAYQAWMDRIKAAGVAILEEIQWDPPLHGRSFYFHDPAGNVLEIADRDIWPTEMEGRS